MRLSAKELLILLGDRIDACAHGLREFAMLMEAFGKHEAASAAQEDAAALSAVRRALEVRVP